MDSRIGNLSGVRYLRLDNNQFTGTIPSSLGVLSGLQYLHLHENDFVGTIPSSFTALTELREFFVQGNNLNRDNRHFAIIPSALTTRYNNIALINNGQTNSQDQ